MEMTRLDRDSWTARQLGFGECEASGLRSPLVALVSALAVACASARAPPPVSHPSQPPVTLPDSVASRPPRPAEYFAADSIALERTACFGTCPVYRVSLARNGDVHFESRGHNDSGRTATDNVGAEAFRGLMGAAIFSRFYELPEEIAADPKYCPSRVTDLPTAVVTVYFRGRSKHVVDYAGCFWAPAALRGLEQEVDEATRSRRWVRSNRF
jgi:hypothetical protein